jgi:hypothetical protein
VWQSLPTSVPGGIDILLALSTDGGATFGPVLDSVKFLLKEVKHLSDQDWTIIVTKEI